MSWQRTEVMTTLRQADGDDPLAFEGVAVPYGVTSTSPVAEYGKKEAFAQGAFAKDVSYWMGRSDGGRLAFRPEHGARPVGTVQVLADTPDGVAFRVQLRDTEAGRDYADQVRSGLNGVSIEFAPVGKPTVKDGFVLHREARLYGIAGSVTPAYEGARLSLRDMEEPNVAVETPTVQDTAEPPPSRTDAQAEAERAGVRKLLTADAQVQITRAEAMYGRDATDERGEWRSFLKDFYLAHNGDSGAMERQERHNRQIAEIGLKMERAGDVISSEIPGAYPNQYLPGLLTPRIMKKRPVCDNLLSFPINDGLPKIFAKVTTSTSATVQASEGTSSVASDLATTAVTATPLLYGGFTKVSRQVIDGASPAAEQMILQDVMESYGQVTEAAAVVVLEAGATASGTAITAATPYVGTVGNVVKYFGTRFDNAEVQFYPAALFAVLLAQPDTGSLRPLLPAYGLTNTDGAKLSGGSGANILGCNIILSWGSTVNVVVTARRADYVIFESATASFRYEQPAGPAAFQLGVYGYFVAATRLGGLSVTAA